MTQAFSIKVSLVSIEGFILSMRVFQNSWGAFFATRGLCSTSFRVQKQSGLISPICFLSE